MVYISKINTDKIVIYFGEDLPKLKDKYVTRNTKNSKKWFGPIIWCNGSTMLKYHYFEVNEPDKLYIFKGEFDFEDCEIIIDNTVLILAKIDEDKAKEIVEKKINI